MFVNCVLPLTLTESQASVTEPRFAIITTHANDLMRPIHLRMSVIPALSLGVQDRIRLEEQFRQKVRSQLEAQDAEQTKNGGPLAFFNSKLGIFVL